MNEICNKNKRYCVNEVLNMNTDGMTLEKLVKKSKKQRGQNKNRKRMFEKEMIQLCPRISLNKECEYGDA